MPFRSVLGSPKKNTFLVPIAQCNVHPSCEHWLIIEKICYLPDMQSGNVIRTIFSHLTCYSTWGAQEHWPWWGGGLASCPVQLHHGLPPHPGPACLAKWEVGVGNLKCSWLQSTFTRSHWSPAMTCFTPREVSNFPLSIPSWRRSKSTFPHKSVYDFTQWHWHPTKSYEILDKLDAMKLEENRIITAQAP